MSLAFKRLKVYVKLTLVVLVIAAGTTVLWKNRGHEVHIWFFWVVDEATPVNVVWLMLSVAAASLLAYWAMSLVWGLWRDMRKIARESTIHHREKEQDELAKRLDEQEKRIDAKLKKAISDKP